MDSEWDIIQVLHRLKNKMKEQLELEWIQSHQDDDPTTDIKTLPVGTQPNIKTDELAAQGLNQLKLKPIVPLDSSSEVMLNQQGQRITRDHKVSIRNTI